MAEGSMSRAFVAAMTVVLAAVASAQAVEQRMGVKGVHLGDSLAAVKAKLQLKCLRDASHAFDQACLFARPADHTFAGVAASGVLFGFFVNRLDSVVFLLPDESYDEIRRALDEKFGGRLPDGPTMLRIYKLGDDRASLMRVNGTTQLTFEAGSGADERERRADAAKLAKRKDM